MKCIYQARRRGKTTELIKECAQNEKYSLIVCMSKRECEHVFGEAKEMGLNIPYPITFDEFLNSRYAGQNIDAFYIDNADMLLQSLSRVPIKTVTITNPEEEQTTTKAPQPAVPLSSLGGKGGDGTIVRGAQGGGPKNV